MAITSISPKEFKNMLSKLSKTGSLTAEMKGALSKMGKSAYINKSAVSRKEALSIMGKLKKEGLGDDGIFYVNSSEFQEAEK